MMTLTTPALLFPAISLLFLAYTNRFHVLTQVIRALHDRELREHSDANTRQVSLLRSRLVYIQVMQTFAVLSFLLCTFSMFALFLELRSTGVLLFGVSLLSLSLSLIFALVEVLASTNAISVQLTALDQRCREEQSRA